jgi:hypothetical protein
MKFVCLFAFLFIVHPAFAQSNLPIIKASSKSVSIRDGDHLDKNTWTLSPQIRPDVYTADRTRQTKWVTFYTDIDSIRVKVLPGTRFNFVVLLNGKDSCYTQIASAIAPENKLIKPSTTHDTIPFVLTAYNAIAVKTVINNIDTLTLHFDLGSFDFHLTRDAILKKTKLLANQPDALAGKVVPNYNKLAKVFKLQMGTLTWTNPPVSSTGITAHEMDGRFSWNLFEGKVIEIDYEHNQLRISTDLPKNRKGYTQSPINFIRGLACIAGTFTIDGKTYTGNFSMDTGSAQSIILDSAWVRNQKFPSTLKLLNLITFQDPQGRKYENKVVLVPAYNLNGFALQNIPTLMLTSRNPAGFEINFLGNGLLKRFDIILDMKHDQIYLKPNQLAVIKYGENGA